jgi:hypothetical protein
MRERVGWVCRKERWQREELQATGLGVFPSFIAAIFIDDVLVANMASYGISSSMILVIHDNMINGTNHIV